MKRYILIESDTDMSSLFMYQVTQVSADRFERSHDFANHLDEAKFFGMVRRCLVTKEDLGGAKEITPEIEVAS